MLDHDGVLHVGRSWVSLSPVETRLISVLMDRFGAVVSRDSMERAGWPEDPPTTNVLDAHLVRLRRRLARVGLVIRNVRSRGFLLEPVIEATTLSGSAVDVRCDTVRNLSGTRTEAFTCVTSAT